jgi:hypothetical protein
MTFFFFLGFLLARQVTAASSQVEIRIDNRSIFFKGDFTHEVLAKFNRQVEGVAPGDLDRIVINSGGGDTQVGRALGRWVRQMGLDVEVDEMCFSSCANYVFPAGDGKIIRDGAFVGWHGSETQSNVLALSNPQSNAQELERASLTEALRESGVPEESLPALIEEQLALIAFSKTDEARYFTELGLNGEFTLHGLRPEHLPALEASGKPGWTYSLSDMELLGLTNVRFHGVGFYKSSQAVHGNLVVVEYQPEIVILQ